MESEHEATNFAGLEKQLGAFFATSYATFSAAASPVALDVLGKQIAALDKIETALEDLSKLLQERTTWHAHDIGIPGMLLLQALTPDKQSIVDELVIRVIREKLALLRESIAQ